MDHPEKAVERAVIDGEIVEENQGTPAEPAGRGGLARRQTVHVITTLAKPGTAKAVGQSVGRVGYTTVQGHLSWVRRASNAATHGVIREQIRAARLAGDREALAEWTERLEDAKDARSKRLLALPRMVLNALIVATIGAIGLLFLLLIGGIAAWVMPGGIGWTDWWGGIGTVIGTTAAVVKFVAGASVFLGLPLLLVLAYREGRRAGDPPRWLATTADADVDVTIDETTIAAALAALRVPQITDYLKSGTPLQFITPARVDGR
jgi:S-DNA-T family DNA segregation ATPase FtsK/SpoIIIE